MSVTGGKVGSHGGQWAEWGSRSHLPRSLCLLLLRLEVSGKGLCPRLGLRDDHSYCGDSNCQLTVWYQEGE